MKEYSGLEENKVTKIWMMKKGIGKVRGASYSQCVLPAQQLASLKRELWHNKCMIYTRGCKVPSTTIIKRVLHMNISSRHTYLYPQINVHVPNESLITCVHVYTISVHINVKYKNFK